METNYPRENSGYENSLEVGLKYQDWVASKIKDIGFFLQYHQSQWYQYRKGESQQGWEIKLDKLCTRTNRLSIEIAEKTRATNSQWIKSGIYRNDNSLFYIQGNETRFWAFKKQSLIEIHQSGRYQGHEEKTVMGYFLPLAMAEKICFFSYPFNTQLGIWDLYNTNGIH